MLRLAHELGLTYYDSSYVVAAAVLNVPLVTDDVKLRDSINSRKGRVRELLNRSITVYSSNEYVSKSSE